MELKFVDCKSELSYVTLLPKITFKYCNNSDEIATPVEL